MTRVACIGECMVELSLPPATDPGGAARVGFAGDAANVAIYLAREGGGRIAVAFVTALGDDPLSDRMAAFLAAEGLETGLIERRRGQAPGLYAISVDAQGERSFTYWREASAARTLFLPPAEVTPERLTGFDLVYLSGITLAIMSPEARAALLGFLEGYRARGGLVAFDSNYRPRLWRDAAEACAAMSDMWRLTDVGLPSFDDEAALWGDRDAAETLARLAAAGVRRGALKRGAEGPLAIGWEGALPDFPSAEPRDTTAAGDSFNGAFLAATLAGAPPPDCLAAGHALASRVVQHFGAIMPSQSRG